jgi:hypothetical protein
MAIVAGLSRPGVPSQALEEFMTHTEAAIVDYNHANGLKTPECARDVPRGQSSGFHNLRLGVRAYRDGGEGSKPGRLNQ